MYHHKTRNCSLCQNNVVAAFNRDDAHYMVLNRDYDFRVLLCDLPPYVIKLPKEG